MWILTLVDFWRSFFLVSAGQGHPQRPTPMVVGYWLVLKARADSSRPAAGPIAKHSATDLVSGVVGYSTVFLLLLLVCSFCFTAEKNHSSALQRRMPTSIPP